MNWSECVQAATAEYSDDGRMVAFALIAAEVERMGGNVAAPWNEFAANLTPQLPAEVTGASEERVQWLLRQMWLLMWSSYVSGFAARIAQEA